MSLLDLFIMLKGGAGSGNWGHAGIPGKRGGSAPRSTGMSISTGRDAARRQQAAKDKSTTFFKGNLRNATPEEVYNGSSKAVKDLADETGVVATDKATFDYISSRKENFKDTSQGIVPEHTDMLNIVNSKMGTHPTETKTVRELLDSDNYTLRSYTKDAINSYASGGGGLSLTSDEKNLFDKLSAYKTKTYGMDGARAEKAINNLTLDERRVFNNYAIKEIARRTVENVGSNYRWDKLSFSDPNYYKKSEGIRNAMQKMVDLTPKYPIQNNESINDYKARLYNTPEAKQIFSNVTTGVPASKMVALASVSTEENRDVVGKYSQTWDKTNHKFKGWVNGVYRIIPQKEVTDRYNEAQAKYGNVQRGFYHGTHELVGQKISANGFIIPKTPKAGRMLGDGVYLAQNSSKSMQYIGTDFTRSAGTRGVMFELEAAMDSKVNWEQPGWQTAPGNTVEALKGNRLLNSEWAIRDPAAVIPRYWLDVEIR